VTRQPLLLDGIVNFASNDGIHVNANENFGRPD